MKERLFNLGRQTLVYGISAAALQLVGVVTLPVFARTFSPAEYGVLELAMVGLAAMLVMADLGMASASQRSYFDYSDAEGAERRAVLATAIITALAAASAIAVALVVFRGQVASWLFHDTAHTQLVVLVALALPVSVLANLLRQVMRLRFMAWRYSISAVAGAVVAAAVGIALVLGVDTGVEGVLIGVLAGNAVAVAVGISLVARYVGSRVSRRELRVMLAYGLPLIPAGAAMWGLAFLDRLMLSRLADLDEVGQYAVGARLASPVLMFVVAAFGLAYAPFVLALYAEDRDTERQLRGRTLTYVAIVLTALSLVLALFGREIITVVAPDFGRAYEVVGVLCLGLTVFGLSSVAMTGISLTRQTSYFAAFSVVAVVVNVVLNLVLIPPLGGLGAALATTGAYVALMVLYYRKAQALYPTPYRPGKSLAVLAAGAALMPLGLLPLGIGAFALKVLAVLAFAGIVIGAVLDQPELNELRSLTRSLLRRAATSPR